MNESLKTGKEVVDLFFETLSDSAQLDKAVVETLKKLHKEDRLTPANIANALDTIRNEALNDVNR